MAGHARALQDRSDVFRERRRFRRPCRLRRGDRGNQQCTCRRKRHRPDPGSLLTTTHHRPRIRKALNPPLAPEKRHRSYCARTSISVNVPEIRYVLYFSPFGHGLQRGRLLQFPGLRGPKDETFADSLLVTRAPAPRLVVAWPCLLPLGLGLETLHGFKIGLVSRRRQRDPPADVDPGPRTRNPARPGSSRLRPDRQVSGDSSGPAWRLIHRPAACQRVPAGRLLPRRRAILCRRPRHRRRPRSYRSRS